MKPLFSVGEEVIVLWKGSPVSLRVIEAIDHTDSDKYELLNGIEFVGYCYKLFGRVNYITERIIRKKPPLGDSYDQLIADLKNPSHVGVSA